MRLVAVAIPIPRAVGVGVTEHDRESVVDFGQGVQHDTATQVSDAEGITPAQPLGGDRLRVADRQVDAQPVGRSAQPGGQPGQLVGRFGRRRASHRETPDVEASCTGSATAPGAAPWATSF